MMQSDQHRRQTQESPVFSSNIIKKSSLMSITVAIMLEICQSGPDRATGGIFYI